MSFMNIFRSGLQRRRLMYHWAGSFICIVGVLLLIMLILRNVTTRTSVLPTFVGGYCAIFASFMSIFQILEHLACFSDPECQTKIVRILFMVPLFALISWISLLAPGAAQFLNLIRDAYESYVIYSFFQLMIALMGGTDTLYRALMIEERPPMEHFFPLCHLEPIKVSPTFVQHCRLCLFQFMVIKPLVTIIVAILTAKNEMGDSLADLSKGLLWTTLVYNISITIAFTALIYFYTALKDFMEGKNPLLKFLCIKAVIFLSFWQGVLIQILAAVDLLPQFSYWTKQETPTALQDLLVCVEMMFVAFAHRYCFGSDEYAVVDNAYSPASDTGATPVTVIDDDRGDNFAAGGILSHGTIPMIRYSITENLKYTLRHEDILSDMKDIVRNR